MNDKLNHLLSNSIATTTARTYQTANHKFIQFCNSASFIPYPASSLTLQYFLPSLPDKLSYTTIKTYLAAIGWHHINKSPSNPTSNKCLLYVMKGIKRLQVRSTSKQMAITLLVLKNLKIQLHRSEISFHDKRMLWAAFYLAFYGFLRSAEFVVSSIIFCREDTTMGSEITVIIKAFKTDQIEEGPKSQSVVLARLPVLCRQ